MNKQDFWNKTTGTFSVIAEGDFLDLISTGVNLFKDDCGFTVNFNEENDTFYIRCLTFAVRISNKWGNVGDCVWNLDRDVNPEKYQMVKINYNNLKKL